MTSENPATAIQKRWRGYVTRSRKRIYVDDGSNNPNNIGFGSSAGSLSLAQGTPGKLEEVPELVSRQSEASLLTNKDPPLLTPSQSVKSRGRLLEPPRTPPPKMNECVLPTETISTEKIPFSKDYDVEIIMEEAVGLPLTTTATRIHTRLHMPTKEDQRDVSTFAYSDLHSDYTNPRYGFAVKWRGRYLHQTMTILIRIDTLESPHLEPRVIGFCALRLCVDTLGMQPLSEVLFDGRPSCFFNNGEFLVPILYGVFPADIPFITESKFQECLPVIPNAFLKIRLQVSKSTATPSSNPLSVPPSSNKIDITSQSSRRLSSTPLLSTKFSPPPAVPVLRMSSSILMIDVTTSPKSGKDHFNLFSKSVASVMLKTYLVRKEKQTSNSAIPLLQLDNSLVELFKRGQSLEPDQRQAAIRQMTDYVQQVFNMDENPKLAINSKYLLEYSEEHGALAGLDMLYNMPERKRLIPAAETSASVAAMRSGISNRWDNKINCFKTVFRYLPGALSSSKHSDNGMNNNEYKDTRDGKESINPATSTAGGSGGDILVVDDASVKLSLNSIETCPAYLDEFSCTVGMKFGPYACLLVVVTAVDVLTSKRAASTRSLEELTLNNSSGPHPSMLSPSNSRASLFSADDSAKNERMARAQKLKGLRGIHSGHGDPKTTWWGLVPLFTKFPSAFISSENMTGGGVAVRDHSEAMTLPGSESHNHNNHLVIDGDDATSLSSLSALPLFVNFGAHQVPLFQGLPPEEMITAPDPFAWVVSRLHYQVSRRGDSHGQGNIVLKMLAVLSGGCLPSPSSSSGSSSNEKVLESDLPMSSSSKSETSSRSTKSKRQKSKKKKKTEDIILSPGCSAFIRMVDPRVKRLAGPPISVDTDREFNMEILNELIQLQAHYAVDDKGILSLQLDQSKLRHLKHDFQFAANRFSGKRTIRMAIPETIDPQYLLQELNTKFYQSLST